MEILYWLTDAEKFIYIPVPSETSALVRARQIITTWFFIVAFVCPAALIDVCHDEIFQLLFQD